MLNDKLYKRLVDVFGSVKVHSRSVRAYRDASGRIKGGEYYAVPCPYCDDHGHHLWVSYLYDRDDSLAICFRRDCLSDEGNRLDFRLRVLRRIPARRARRKESAAARNLDLPSAPSLNQVLPPGNIIPLSDLDEGHEARVFLEERRIDPDEASRIFGAGYCEYVHDRRFLVMTNRLYIPVYHHGSLVGWQGRLISGYSPDKYYTMPGFAKSMVLYGYDYVDRNGSGPIVLAEGALDVWSIGPGAVCVLGGTLSHMQRTVLCGRLARRRGVVVCLDEDARDKAERIASDLRSAGNDRVAILDPSRYGVPGPSRDGSIPWMDLARDLVNAVETERAG